MRSVALPRALGLPQPGPQDALRGAAAAGEGVRLVGAASLLYDAGGRHVLTAPAQSALRNVAERAAGNVLGEGAASAALATRGAAGVARSVTREAAKTAGREILKGVGKAAGIGFAIDGAVATVEAVVAVRAGEMTRPDALKHVGKEAASGAIATAAGTIACVGLVALTGPLSLPALFVWGAGCSLGAKTALRRLMK